MIDKTKSYQIKKMFQCLSHRVDSKVYDVVIKNEPIYSGQVHEKLKEEISQAECSGSLNRLKSVGMLKSEIQGYYRLYTSTKGIDKKLKKVLEIL